MNSDEAAGLRRSFLLAVPSALDAPRPLFDVAVEFGARSQRGPQRSVNDDHYLLLRLERHVETLMTSLADGDLPEHFSENAHLMIVADGMGAAGEPASRLAIATFVRLAIEFGKWHVRIAEPIADEMMDRGERFFRNVDSTLRQAGYDSQRPLQTTLSAVYAVGHDLFFAHVGHSRAYVFRNDQLIQLTRDHTVAQGHSDKPVIVDVSAGAQDHQHIVTDTLGVRGAGALQLDVERCGLLDGDLILLCTNGLTDVVEDARIAAALRAHHTPDDQAQALVDLVTSSGGSDDVTVLVAQHRIRTRAGAAAVAPEA